MAEPMVSHDCVAFYLLSEEVAKSVKVVQSGQGADEVFAGYNWYPPLAGVPRERAVEAYARVFTDRPHAELAEILEPEWLLDARPQPGVRRRALRARPGADETLDAALRLDSTVMLVDDPVKRVDNMTMAWGLEARVPFLDHELVELAAACPPELKLAHGGKGVLKEAARGVVPDAIIDRPKGYFPVPAIRHLEGPFLDRVRDAVTDPGREGPRAGPRRLAGRDAGRPEHRANQPGFERVVAGRAAGDVVAGEGVVVGPIRSTGAAARLDEPVPGAVRDRLLRSGALPRRRPAGLDLRPRRPPARLGRAAAAGRRPDRRAGLPLPTDADDLPGDVQALSWSPDGLWLACQLAPVGGERTRVRLVRPDGAEIRELAPGAAAVTLGSWSPGGRQLGITVFPEGSGDGQACLVDLRDGTSTVLASRPRRPGLRGQRRRSGAPSSGSAGAARGGSSWSTCGPAGAPSCCPAARRPSPTRGSASPARSSTCTPTPAASGPRCSP